MFRRTSSCPHFTTSPPPTPPPPPLLPAAAKTTRSRRGDRCPVVASSCPHPPARHAAARRPPDSPLPPLPRRGWIRPGVGGSPWRRRAAARSWSEGNAVFFGGFDPGKFAAFKKSQSRPGLDLVRADSAAWGILAVS